MYWTLITLGPLALSVAIGAATSSDMAITRVLPGEIGTFLITTALFYAIYKFVPNRPVSWKPAMISGFIIAVLWNLARIGYAFYTANFVKYNKIYGSLAAIPILLVWIYIVWIIVLGGAALTATLQKRLEILK